MVNNSTAIVNHGRSLPETTSRCSTESVTATHNFEVADYPLLDGLGVNKYISSCVFSVGGYDWTIRFYPDGNKKGESAGNASAFLYCANLPTGVRAKFTLNMLEKEGKVQLTNFGLLEHTFSPPTDNFGYSTFVKKSRLKSSSSGVNSGCLIIRCVLTVIKEPRTEVKRNLFVVPRPNLQDHLKQMWKDGQGADVTFSVSGQLFSAHRYLLAARSPVFKAELFGPMKKATDSITIDDIEPPIFEALLHFIYTDSILDDWDNKEGKTAKLQHLLVAADRYGLERLRVMCVGRLCDIIDVETVATTLVLAEQHHCSDLKETCIGFMTSQNKLGDIMATDGFKHLMSSWPLLMKDILDKVSCVL
uniref:BTB/POZ and MATH domain-containing protein 1 n=2 Tax=Triticum urartu TaxID=4572 RepID=A0A8R7PQY5_TRIUA